MKTQTVETEAARAKHRFEALLSQNFGGFLFDMDGTLLSSIASAERTWARWARQQGLDVEKFLPTIHGARSVDTIRRLNIADLDPIAEARWVTENEILDTEGITEIPGAMAFLQSIPREKWAVVTSATKALAQARLKSVKFPMPAFFVTGEDVEEGKPNPEGFRLGAKRLGLSPEECLVFEDAAVGVEAGLRSGASVLVMTSTHRHPLTLSLPEALLERSAEVVDYTHLRVRENATGRLELFTN